MARQYQLPKWLQYSIIVLVILGIFCRFTNLDQKPYWYDEAYTSLRMSGYTVEETVDHLFNGQVISAQTVQKFQKPNHEKGLIYTVLGLAVDEPQHPPFYYLMQRIWSGYFGASVSVNRCLPAVISLFGFLAIYWLCWELFGSATVGLFAIALYGVSPIYIRYAQEARQYSLWIVLILASSAIFLRAIRTRKNLDWSIYAALVSASLYCHLLSGLVVVGHFSYIFLVENFRFTKTIVAQLAAIAIGVLTFSPWMLIVIQHQDKFSATTKWTTDILSWQSMIIIWSLHICRAFIAWYAQFDEPQRFIILLVIPILALVICAIFCLCKTTSKEVWLFVVLLMGITALALLLPDLILGGRRSSSDRYSLPCYLGIHLSVAYLFSVQIVRRKIWKIIIVFLLSASLVSMVISSRSSTWWGWAIYDIEIPSIISQFSRSLVISDSSLGSILSLSHRLEPNTQLLLLTDPNKLQIPNDFEHVFFFNPSADLRSIVEQNYHRLELSYQSTESVLSASLYHLLPD